MFYVLQMCTLPMHISAAVGQQTHTHTHTHTQAYSHAYTRTHKHQCMCTLTRTHTTLARAAHQCISVFVCISVFDSTLRPRSLATKCDSYVALPTVLKCDANAAEFLFNIYFFLLTEELLCCAAV